MKLQKLPMRRIEASSLYEYLRNDVGAGKGLNYFEVIGSDKQVIEKGIFHQVKE